MTEALRVCRVCGNPLYGKRADTRTCGDSCRKSAAQHVRQEGRTRDLSVTTSPTLAPDILTRSAGSVSQISAHKTGVWTGQKAGGSIRIIAPAYVLDVELPPLGVSRLRDFRVS
jgi:hypothetical protein